MLKLERWYGGLSRGESVKTKVLVYYEGIVVLNNRASTVCYEA